MSARPYKPAEMPGLMPYLVVSDAKKSLEFYHKAFDFSQAMDPMEHEGKIVHAEMTFLDTRVMFAPEGAMGNPVKTPNHSDHPCPINLYIYCENVDQHFEKAKNSGAKILSQPEDAFWGDRMYRVSDPDGYIWTFAQNIADFDPKNIPQ